MGSPQYFTKVTTDTSHELFSWLNEKPLRWAVLMTISARVASKYQVTTGLSKGEFFISETEYQKFGLSLSERGKLRRTIFELIEVKIIEKIENKNGNKNCAVYRFLDSDFIDCSRENREQNREQIENRQRTDREQIETNKECKNERNTEITNVIEKNSQGGDTEKKEYGDARINYALRVMREKFQRDDFKESKKMQRIFAKQLLTLGKKIGKDEFHKRCTAIAEDPFKFKNCGSLKYIYGELKSYTEILTEEQRKEQARKREIEESDRRSQETWDRIMAKRALYQSQENT